MTRKQTGPEVEAPYGLGFGFSEGRYRHGGSLNTDMTIHTGLGIITVFLVQHAGAAEPAAEARAAFEKEAEGVFRQGRLRQGPRGPGALRQLNSHEQPKRRSGQSSRPRGILLEACALLISPLRVSMTAILSFMFDSTRRDLRRAQGWCMR